MQFNSIPYLVFLALGVIVYFALPGRRSRTLWLLAASYAFYYSLSATWTIALVAITALGYVFGRLIERNGPGTDTSPMSARAKQLLTAGIVLVGGTLAFFKYADFATSLLNRGLALFGSGTNFTLLALALPVGISFWTFQTIAYLVDVARGKLAAERNVARYALFISFFPHVAAGPIARGGQLLPQFAEKHRFSFQQMRSGLLLMAWGFFKKLLVADSLAVVVNRFYSDPHAFGGSGLLLAAATVAFAIQIYCDFSGYTDIARGSARLFGVDLMPNFNRPYAARSIKEFWRRWHMTLMSWLKDYIYIPLGGSRVPKWRRYVNILAVFLFSGLWHGAGLTFVVWGLINGLYQILGEFLAPARERLLALSRIARDGRIHRLVQTVTTFVLISVAWVFFRAETLSDALFIVPRMFLPTLAALGDGKPLNLGLSKPELIVTAVAVLVVWVVDYTSSRIDLPGFVYRQPLVARWAFYLLAVLVIVIFGHYGSTYDAANFAYFKF